MSIQTPPQSPKYTMASGKHKSKSEKKHKSSKGEKKRKRDNEEDGHRSKTRKHRSEKTGPDTSETHATTSPFHVQTSSLYLPLAPVSQNFPLEGLCAEHISPLILTYYPPFKGVLLSYSNPRLSEKPFGNDGDNPLLQNIDEYAVSWAWVTADFLLFKPETGAWLEGYINLQNEGHLGLVCWNLFNASIERKRLPPDWKWIGVAEQRNEDVEGQGETYAEEGAGYYVDGRGNKIDGTVKFRVKEIESSHERERGFLSIEGTMLGEDSENQLTERERETAGNGRDSAGTRLGGWKALGATSLGVPAAPELMDVDRGAKQRQKQ